MNEDALRAIIRDTIARLAGPAEPSVSDAPRLLHMTPHPSSYQYALPPSDGPCIIEANGAPDLDIIQRTMRAPLGTGELGRLMAYHLEVRERAS